MLGFCITKSFFDLYGFGVLAFLEFRAPVLQDLFLFWVSRVHGDSRMHALDRILGFDSPGQVQGFCVVYISCCPYCNTTPSFGVTGLGLGCLPAWAEGLSAWVQESGLEFN